MHAQECRGDEGQALSRDVVLWPGRNKLPRTTPENFVRERRMREVGYKLLPG